MVTLIPQDRNLNAFVLTFYFLIDGSPHDFLREDPSFQRWSGKFAKEWGAFLDTAESAEGITGFFANPAHRIEDDYVLSSGWRTFNPFFARRVRPGRRPVEGRCDDDIVVSPADSVYRGRWPVISDSTISVKGLTWSVIDLLAGSPDQNKFCGGMFTHSFLNVKDYHWFHAPVGGVVKEVRKIPGRVTMDVIKNADGTLGIVDGTGYQFTQDRGIVVIDSPLGLVTVLPIGMAKISPVNLSVEVGETISKGEEFGFFRLWRLGYRDAVRGGPRPTRCQYRRALQSGPQDRSRRDRRRHGRRLRHFPRARTSRS